MVLEPLLEYIQRSWQLRQEQRDHHGRRAAVRPPRWWSNLMRTQMGVLLRLSLPFETGIVITDVPYVLEGEDELDQEFA